MHPPSLNIHHFSEPPDRPLSPRAIEVHTSSCTLVWKAPEEDGGSPITEYFVEFKREGGAGWILIDTPVENRHFCVDSLIRSSWYQFRITAANKKGRSRPGYESDPIETVGNIFVHLSFY